MFLTELLPRADLLRVYVPELKEWLRAGERFITLQVRFNAPLRTTMHGFYISEYRDGGKSHVLAATDLEPAGARLVSLFNYSHAPHTIPA